MENRNILMVIISIAVLFVIVFGIALMITWPKNPSGQMAGNKDEITSINKPGKPTATPQDRIVGALPTDALLLPTPTPTESGNPLAIEYQDEPESTIKIVYNQIEKTPPPVPVPARTKIAAQSTVRKATAAPKNYPQRITEYWIQSGSFKSRNSAESQNDKLAEKGFFGQVKTKVVDGSTWYRVRIGPYTNKNEANKFLVWIKEIPDMKDSYISENYVIR